MDSKKKRFNKIVNDIKKVKIQGASNISKSALEAYSLIPNKKSKLVLLNSRPTEPLMEHVLEMADKISKGEILNHFSQAQNKINILVFNLIKDNDVIFTHCHSTNVVKALIYSNKKKKKFEVYNTETRPLYQGRKTAKELSKNRIRVTLVGDSSIGLALSHKQDFKKVNKIFIGADALLQGGIVNKIGSGLLARIAKEEKIPLYVIADSWKYTKKKIPLEQRPLNEVWDKAPKNIKIKNSAFEFVDKKYITGIITELGLITYQNFVKRVSKKNS
jgi:translation initiation factor 2B subunit (eIF-2B alpha/beta/delta family)